MEIEFTCADEAILNSRMGINTIFILNRLTVYGYRLFNRNSGSGNKMNVLVEGNVGLSEEIGYRYGLCPAE